MPVDGGEALGPAFVSLPELRSVLVVDADGVESQLRSQRALLAALSLTERSIRSEIRQIETRRDALPEPVPAEEFEGEADDEVLERLGTQIDEARARTELALAAARDEASGLVIDARREAARILVAASDSFGLLGALLDGASPDVAVGQPVVDGPPEPSDASETVEPLEPRQIEALEALEAPELLEPRQLETFLDHLEASIGPRIELRQIRPWRPVPVDRSSDPHEEIERPLPRVDTLTPLDLEAYLDELEASALARRRRGSPVVEPVSDDGHDVRSA